MGRHNRVERNFGLLQGFPTMRGVPVVHDSFLCQRWTPNVEGGGDPWVTDRPGSVKHLIR